ncbi:MAG: hypothetical protein F4Y58_02245 [Gammaproteobacteria bacterium]|nr:hypothetical protein [Gammaproteobacteria bacterium]
MQRLLILISEEEILVLQGINNRQLLYRAVMFAHILPFRHPNKNPVSLSGMQSFNTITVPIVGSLNLDRGEHRIRNMQSWKGSIQSFNMITVPIVANLNQ